MLHVIHMMLTNPVGSEGPARAKASRMSRSRPKRAGGLSAFFDALLRRPQTEDRTPCLLLTEEDIIEELRLSVRKPTYLST